MRDLYDIISSLRFVSGSNAKLAIMQANKDNQLFKAYMQAVYDVTINYYTTKLPKSEAHPDELVGPFDQWDLEGLAEHVKKRTAKTWFQAAADGFDAESLELCQYILDRSIGAGVGDTMVLKTWPDLYFVPPYQRCSSMTPAIAEKFHAVNTFYVQTKCDGQFAYVIHTVDGKKQVMTRAGNLFPDSFAENLCEGMEENLVVMGELEVLNSQGKLLDRKTGNGLLNSAQTSGELPEGHKARLTARDCLSDVEFKSGRSSFRYDLRFDALKRLLTEKMVLVQHDEVSSLQEAYAIYSRRLAEGLEGCVIKLPGSKWKDGTSMEMVKLKLQFEAEYICTGMYEGEKTLKGMLGGLNMASKCGKIVFNVGTGFTKDQRKAIWMHEVTTVGRIHTISANEIVQSRDERKPASLFLPVYEMARLGKTEADTYEQVVAAKAAAINSACNPVADEV